MSRWKHVYEPTEAEIREACAEIQAGWTPEERQKRAGYLTSRAPSESGRRARSTISEPHEAAVEL